MIRVILIAEEKVQRRDPRSQTAKCLPHSSCLDGGGGMSANIWLRRFSCYLSLLPYYPFLYWKGTGTYN